MRTTSDKRSAAEEVDAALDDLLSASNEGSHSRSASRIGAMLFIVGGLLVLLTEWAVPNRLATAVMACFAGLAIISGLILPALPWERWSTRALLVMPILGHVLLGVAGWMAPGALDYYAALYVLCYLYIGLSQPPGTAIRFVPITIASLALASLGEIPPMVTCAVVVALGVVLAETLSMVMARQTTQQTNMTRLLDASQRLSRATTMDDAIDVLCAVAIDVLGADTARVVLAEATGSTKFALRARADEGLAPMSTDIAEEPSAISAALQRRTTLFVPDTSSSAVTSPRLTAETGAASVVAVPLLGPAGPIGAVVAWWEKPVSRLDAFGEKAMELLAVQSAGLLDTLLAKERLAHEAATDGLTKLSNRRACQSAIDSASDRDVVVLFDLDNFKDVNDRYGHQTGDDVLVSFAACMRQAARAQDCTARFGGDEFAVVLRGAGLNGAELFLERLHEAWRATDPLTTYSAGVAEHRDGEGPLTLLGRADAALYEAKAAGRDRVVTGVI